MEREGKLSVPHREHFHSLVDESVEEISLVPGNEIPEEGGGVGSLNEGVEIISDFCDGGSGFEDDGEGRVERGRGRRHALHRPQSWGFSVAQSAHVHFSLERLDILFL